jgi:hypothetical protein
MPLKTTLAAAREARPTPTSESGMPTTLWKWIVLKGKYRPCPNRNASIARRSSHTRRSKLVNFSKPFGAGRSYPEQRPGNCKIRAWQPDKEDASVRRTGQRSPQLAD